MALVGVTPPTRDNTPIRSFHSLRIDGAISALATRDTNLSSAASAAAADDHNDAAMNLARCQRRVNKVITSVREQAMAGVM